ncbi:MAG: TolC family protein [Lachnospiraceae bacterium]|nr:TolC family protein [Lachnospiraceae bacterium]
MKRINLYKILAFIISICMVTPHYAISDYIGEYFDGISPDAHIYRYDNKKGSLPSSSIDYENIDSYVHYYNPEVLNYWNDWENNKSSENIYDDYVAAADNLYASAGSSDSDLQAGIANAQGDAMMIQADKNVVDSYVNFLDYYLKEKKLVLATKIHDINYHKSEYEVLNAEEEYNEAVRKEESADNALKYGSGTEVEYLTAKKQTIDARSSKVAAESSRKTYMRNLLINCGMAYDADIFVAPFDLEEGLDVSNINLENDYQYALAHNVQYEIYRRKRNNARTTEVQKEYDILIEAAPKNIYNDLETKYSNILDLVETKYNREIAYSLALSNYTKAQNEYSAGNISEKEYMTFETNVRKALYNLAMVKYDFKIAFEEYNASVMGYGNS